MDTPAETTASPVLLPQGPDQKHTFEHLVPQVTNGAELLQFHAVDAMVKDLSTRRKAENARLLAFEKAWEVRKSELEPQLKAMVNEALVEGQRTAQTMLASTYVKDREDSVSLPDGEDEKLIQWFHEVQYERGSIVPGEDSVTVVKLTTRGRDKIKFEILLRAKAGLDIPPGVTITPAGKTVVTRARSSPGGNRLTAHQVLAQHGKHLDRLVDNNENQEPQENQDDKHDSRSILS